MRPMLEDFLEEVVAPALEVGLAEGVTVAVMKTVATPLEPEEREVWIVVMGVVDLEVDGVEESEVVDASAAEAFADDEDASDEEAAAEDEAAVVDEAPFPP
jgi:hypothetical protein